MDDHLTYNCCNLEFESYPRARIFKTYISKTPLLGWKIQASFYVNVKHGPIHRSSEIIPSGRKIRGEYQLPLRIGFDAINHVGIDRAIKHLIETPGLAKSEIDAVLHKLVQIEVNNALKYALEMEKVNHADVVNLTQLLEQQGGIATLVEDGCCLYDISIKLLEGRLFSIFCFTCQWEPEHGVSIILENEKIIALGGSHDFDDKMDLSNFDLYTQKFEELTAISAE
jgi:hypothetical protein